MRGWARAILVLPSWALSVRSIRCRRAVSTLNVSDTADTVRLRARRSLGILENPTCGRVYVMTLARSTAGINKAEDAGRMDAQIRSAKALQRVFPTTVASYLTFHGSVRQEATGNRQD